MNCTIPNPQLWGESIFEWLFVLALLQLCWAAIVYISGTENRRGYNCPDGFADDYRDIPYGELKERGIEVLCFDVDRTLVRLGLFAFFSFSRVGFLNKEQELPTEVQDFLTRLWTRYGFYIMLVTKSNKNVKKMYEDMGRPDWLYYMVTSKSSSKFVFRLRETIAGRGALWSNLSGVYQTAMIGDKLSDMGPPNRSVGIFTGTFTGILTNPKGGHDIFSENFPALRRWREKLVLETFFETKRARRGEFRWKD